MAENEGWPTAPIGHNSGELKIGGEVVGNITAFSVTDNVVEVTVPQYEVKYPGQPSTEEPEAFRLRRNREIEAWKDAKVSLAQVKDYEGGLREKVTHTLFPSPKKGTQRYDLGGGYKVKLVYALNYTLGDKEKTDEDGNKVPVREQIEALEQAILDKHPEAGRLLDRLISWKPELSGSEYEKLSKDDPLESSVARMIDEHLTVKPASPQLVFEEPKAS